MLLLFLRNQYLFSISRDSLQANRLLPFPSTKRLDISAREQTETYLHMTLKMLAHIKKIIVHSSRELLKFCNEEWKNKTKLVQKGFWLGAGNIWKLLFLPEMLRTTERSFKLLHDLPYWLFSYSESVNSCTWIVKYTFRFALRCCLTLFLVEVVIASVHLEIDEKMECDVWHQLHATAQCTQSGVS